MSRPITCTPLRHPGVGERRQYSQDFKYSGSHKSDGVEKLRGKDPKLKVEKKSQGVCTRYLFE